jgi:hypothetical protein
MPQLTITASLVTPALAPVMGPAVFGRPLAAAQVRPSAWATRVAVVPLTAADTYSYVVFDLLSVSASSHTDEAQPERHDVEVALGACGLPVPGRAAYYLAVLSTSCMA